MNELKERKGKGRELGKGRKGEDRGGERAEGRRTGEWTQAHQACDEAQQQYKNKNNSENFPYNVNAQEGQASTLRYTQ